MTTKKQRRERTATKTAAAREALRLENLKLLKESQARSEQRKFEAERSAKKKAAKKDEVIPENLKDAFDLTRAV